MSGYYVLHGRKAVEAESLQGWSSWFFQADREIARTRLANGASVTTEFVGVDHRAPGETGAPLLFETRTFDPDWGNVSRRRYATWSEAKAGHRQEVRRRGDRSD